MFSVFKLGILFIVIVIVLFIIFSNMFRLASFIKVLSISIIVAAIIFGIIVTILYINDIGYKLLGTSKKYVIGQIMRVSDNQVNIRVIDHNLDIEICANDNINVRVTGDTIIKQQIGTIFEEKVDFKELKYLDRVNVICSEVNNGYITAQKIVVK